MSKKDNTLKDEKHIYEIWTFIYDIEHKIDKKPGKCHGRFETKKEAKKALKYITERRFGKPYSLFTDGTKVWHFKIFEHTINKSEDYKYTFADDCAVYDSKKKEWILHSRYSKDKSVLLTGALTKDNFKKAKDKLESRVSSLYHRDDAPEDSDEKVSPELVPEIPTVDEDEPF